MTVRKNRHGHYFVDIKFEHANGTVERLRKVSPVQTFRGAQAYERQVRQELLDRGPAKPEDEKAPRLRDFVERFIRHEATANRPSVVKMKEQILDDHLLGAFGDFRLDEIDARAIDQYKAEKLQTLKPNTVANHLVTLRRVLTLAMDWELIDKMPRFRQVRRPMGKYDYLRHEEEVPFLLAAKPVWRPFLVVAIHTGLRLGELRGLQWGDIDLRRGTVRVERAYTKEGWGEPKSGKGRTIDLDVVAIATLKELRGDEDLPRQTLVFPGALGKPLNERTVYQVCKRASLKAKLGRVINPHALRHTFASHAAIRGVPLPVIQQWMGHADIATTMRYAHLAPRDTAKWAADGQGLPEGSASESDD